MPKYIINRSRFVDYLFKIGVFTHPEKSGVYIAFPSRMRDGGIEGLIGWNKIKTIDGLSKWPEDHDDLIMWLGDIGVKFKEYGEGVSPGEFSVKPAGKVQRHDEDQWDIKDEEPKFGSYIEDLTIEDIESGGEPEDPADWWKKNKPKPSYTFSYNQDEFILTLTISRKKYSYYNISPYKFNKFRAMLRKNFGKAMQYLIGTQS